MARSNWYDFDRAAVTGYRAKECSATIWPDPGPGLSRITILLGGEELNIWAADAAELRRIAEAFAEPLRQLEREEQAAHPDGGNPDHATESAACAT